MDMKAELSKEETSLHGLREVSEKLRKEAEQDEIWRLKYEQEVCVEMKIWRRRWSKNQPYRGSKRNKRGGKGEVSRLRNL